MQKIPLNFAHFTLFLATELRLRPSQVEATVQLLDEGATVPFLARYRKEQSGGLDEVAIEAIRVGTERLRECEKRRAAIVASLGERGLLTPELGKVGPAWNAA